MPEPEARLLVRLTLVALPPRDGDVPPELRLRALLKTALRRFGFRAVLVETVPPADPAFVSSLPKVPPGQVD
jgi:hypothetical protein